MAVTSSSTFEGPPNVFWYSDRVVDFKPNHFPYEPNTCNCCSATKNETGNPYIQIDLGNEYLVSMVQIISRSDRDIRFVPLFDTEPVPRVGKV